MDHVRGHGDSGASAVEYGLIVSAIAAVIILVIFALGRVTNENFEDACTTFADEADTIATC